MKTAELTGAELDYWVAKAEDSPCLTYHGGAPIPFREWVDGQGYRPSSIWAQGGPIIEREKIWFEKSNVAELGGIFAYIEEAGSDVQILIGQQWGDTHLIAAMRAYVASKYGENVPDEKGNQ